MLIDTRFLQPHPLTAAWFEQRQQCEQCANLLRAESYRPGTPGGGGGEVMRCAVAQIQAPHANLAKGRKNDQHLSYCIDAREPGGACGPEGALFAPVHTQDKP